MEMDPLFVEVCRKYLPEIACQSERSAGWTIYYEDGLRFIRSERTAYDLIIIDSTDPFGHGEGLFTKEFYGNCYKALREDGIMVNQHESPFYTEDAISLPADAQADRGDLPHQPGVPGPHSLLPVGALALWICLQKVPSPGGSERRGLEAAGHSTPDTMTPRLHAGAFALPAYVEELLEDVE